MKILYVTELWTGLKDVLFNGIEEARGMPAFINPLKELINRGHQVELVLIHNFTSYPDYNIKANWIKKEQIVGQIYWESKLIKKPLNIVNLNKIVDKIVCNKEYDFIYGHGESISFVNKIANKYNIPFGQRLYGTFMYDYLTKNSKLKSKIIRYLGYNAFKSNKQFLLVTNDGSNGDKAYECINKGKKPSDFYFWHNGIDRVSSIDNNSLLKEYKNISSKPFLFYVARIDKWKRQDEAIKILKLIKDSGLEMKLYIAGQIISDTYYKEIKQLIVELDLVDDVVFMGVIDRYMINIMSKLAIASFSLYDMCNLGNIFHEMLAAGAVIVSKDDGSLDYFIENRKNGFLINSNEEACESIIEIMKDKEYENSIRENAIKTSMTKMKNWEERINDEIDLIKKYAISRSGKDEK